MTGFARVPPFLLWRLLCHNLTRTLRAGMALLCCLLTLAAPVFAQLPPSVWIAPLTPMPAEEEEQQGSMETEDGECGVAGRALSAAPSAGRHRTATPSVIAWLAHLSLPHGSAAGPNLLVRTPSQHATNLPLLC